jgi:hypothetical protein
MSEIQELVDEYGPAFVFLESLRLSGVTNMFGAGSYMAQYGLYETVDECQRVLVIWIENYDDLSLYYRWNE